MKAKFGDSTKVLIAVGGWGDAGFSIAVSNATTRELFAPTVATMLNATDADGLGKNSRISP